VVEDGGVLAVSKCSQPNTTFLNHGWELNHERHGIHEKSESVNSFNEILFPADCFNQANTIKMPARDKATLIAAFGFAKGSTDFHLMPLSC